MPPMIERHVRPTRAGRRPRTSLGRNAARRPARRSARLANPVTRARVGNSSWKKLAKVAFHIWQASTPHMTIGQRHGQRDVCAG